MGEMEKGFILGSLAQMDQASKNFVLGYMAGRCSDVSATDEHHGHERNKREGAQNDEGKEDEKPSES